MVRLIASRWAIGVIRVATDVAKQEDTGGCNGRNGRIGMLITLELEVI